MQLEERAIRSSVNAENRLVSDFSVLAESMANEPDNLKKNLQRVAQTLCSEPGVSGVTVDLNFTTGNDLLISSGCRVGSLSHDLPIRVGNAISGTLRIRQSSSSGRGLPVELQTTLRMAVALISLGTSHAAAFKRAEEHKASLSAVQVASEVLGTIVEEEKIYSTVLLLIQELMGSEASVVFSADGEALASIGFERFPKELDELRTSSTSGIGRSWRGALDDTESGFAVSSRIGRSGGTISLFRQSNRYRESEEHTLRLVARQLARAQERSRLQAALENTSIEMTESLAAALESRDGTTGDHINRTQDMVESLARKLDLDVEAVRTARFAAVLHDIGKIAVPDAILNKPGKLDEDEWEIMREHPAKGAKILSGISGFERVAAAVLTHHERYDGDGYPEGISGENIPIEARIISVVDAYDAMTSDRPYRKALSHETAIAELNAQSGRQFDPSVVEVLKEIVEETTD